MTRKVTSFRLSTLATRQLGELTAKLEMNNSEIVSTAIDRMYQQEIATMSNKPDYFSDPITKLALDVYHAAYQPYGEANPDRVGEIEAWLREGDLDDSPDADALAAEWLALETE